MNEEEQGAPPPSEPATLLAVNRNPVEGGRSGSTATSLPALSAASGPWPRPPWPPEPTTCLRWAAAVSCAAASAGEWSALEFEQGPEPSQRHLRSRPPTSFLQQPLAPSLRFPQAPRGRPTPQPIAQPLTQTAAQAPRPAWSGARHWSDRGARREL